MVLVGFLLGPGGASADLFDRASRALYATPERKRSYMVGENSALGAGAVPLFPDAVIDRQRNAIKISTPCGTWSLTPQAVMGNLTEMLDPDRLKAALMNAIQSSIQNLVGAVVSKLSMLTVCYAVPTLCDLTKHMQAVAGQLHNIRSLSCQQLEGVVGSVASTLTAGRTSRCIQAHIGQGMSLNVAQRVCASGEWRSSGTNPGLQQGWGLFGDAPGAPGALPGAGFTDNPDPTRQTEPPGERKEQMIVEETLEAGLAAATGMTPAEKDELREFREHMIGDVKVVDTTNPAADETEPAETQLQPVVPKYKLHDYYKSQAQLMSGLLRCAAQNIGGHRRPSTPPTATCSVTYNKTDGTPDAKSYGTTEEILQALSIPGVTLPFESLQSLHRMGERGMTDRQQTYVQKIAGSLAMQRTIWRTRELRDELETGMIGKEDQSEEEREQIEIRLRRLDREAQRMVEGRDTAERFVIPAMQALIMEEEMYQQRLMGEVMGAAKQEQFGLTMNPFGYRY